MDDAISNWIRTLRGESFKIKIFSLLNFHIRIWLFFFISIYFDPIKPHPVHDYYKCNDINHEKFYKCQYVRDPNSGASICSHSWFLLIPAFKLIFDPGARLFKLWSVTKVSNNWATLFCTKRVWSQNWFKIGSFETENDDGQCVHIQDYSHSENETEISYDHMFYK